MSGLLLLLGLLMVAGVSLFLASLAWRATARLSDLPRALARTLIGTGVLLPVLALGWALSLQGEKGAMAPPKMAAPKEDVPTAPSMAEPEAEPTAGEPPPAGGEGDAGTGRGLGEAAPPAAPPGDTQGREDWDVVPVFYGTDRARGADNENITYSNARARRLELGRALVTVPRSHTVPQIERPWAIRIPVLDITIGESEDPNEHFTMKEIRPLDRSQLLDLVRERLSTSERFKNHALVFVHGYNTTFDYAIFRTAQIAYDLKFDGAPFAYSWPSGGGLSSYNYDRESSGQSQRFLKDYLNLVLNETGAQAVSLIAHSMGNQPVLQVLKDLKASKPEHLVFNQIILAAPDVDRDNFEDIAREIQGLAKGITLYAADNDVALTYSKNFAGGVPRAGDVPPGGPVVMSGVDTIDVSAISTDSLGLNHSGYAENNQLLRDIRLLIETGEPPLAREPNLQSVPAGTGQYWRFPRIE